MERIYLDYAATTPVDKRVLDAMMPYMTTEFGNPSSLHAFGQKARAAVQTARDCVAAAIGAEGREILFTAGGTEADNLALFGYLRANCPEGGHLITTAVEHAAVLR
ncbi:MAG: aminotransferase class V-fold PLP-dependent enzyme, partial [Megasphaera micronuciformis]|nr:aminotransferase class V-fold PLP-dependent enzyme [Megasphaera micronuciformis]